MTPVRIHRRFNLRGQLARFAPARPDELDHRMASDYKSPSKSNGDKLKPKEVVDLVTPPKSNQNTTTTIEEPAMMSANPLEDNRNKRKFDEMDVDSEEEDDKEYKETIKKLEYIGRRKVLRAAKKVATDFASSLSKLKDGEGALEAVVVKAQKASNDDFQATFEELSGRMLDFAQTARDFYKESMEKHREIQQLLKKPTNFPHTIKPEADETEINLVTEGDKDVRAEEGKQNHNGDRDHSHNEQSDDISKVPAGETSEKDLD